MKMKGYHNVFSKVVRINRIMKSTKEMVMHSFE